MHTSLPGRNAKFRHAVMIFVWGACAGIVLVWQLAQWYIALSETKERALHSRLRQESFREVERVVLHASRLSTGAGSPPASIFWTTLEGDLCANAPVPTADERHRCPRVGVEPPFRDPHHINLFSYPTSSLRPTPAFRVNTVAGFFPFISIVSAYSADRHEIPSGMKSVFAQV